MNDPALLVSTVYLNGFLAYRDRWTYRDWALDSGAFSAFNSGTTISLQDYIDTAKRLSDEDPTLTEVYSLDVIGDWKASMRNTEEMWRQGVEAIPCYHVGEPEAALVGMSKDYPKIALGGAALMKGRNEQKLHWAEQCFARVWPAKIHGFAFTAEQWLLRLPWHSVDSSTWDLMPCAFGRWKSFGRLPIRGSDQNLRAEIDWFLKLERRAQQHWAGEMKKQGWGDKPDLRLAVVSASSGTRWRSLT
jgi:hypothetical protein